MTNKENKNQKRLKYLVLLTVYVTKEEERVKIRLNGLKNTNKKGSNCSL